MTIPNVPEHSTNLSDYVKIFSYENIRDSCIATLLSNIHCFRRQSYHSRPDTTFLDSYVSALLHREEIIGILSGNAKS